MKIVAIKMNDGNWYRAAAVVNEHFWPMYKIEIGVLRLETHIMLVKRNNKQYFEQLGNA